MNPSTHRRRRRLVALATCGLVVSLAVPLAALGPQEPLGGPLEIGYWGAAATASGPAASAELGMTMTGTMHAQFDFSVFGDGTVAGRWWHEGSTTYAMRGEFDGISGEVEGNVTSSGTGPVGGTNTRLRLDGSSRTVGTITFSADAGSFSFPVDTEDELHTLYLDVYATTCDEAYGLWTLAIEQQFAESGFSSSIDGWWMAIRDNERVHDHLRDLIDRVRDATGPAPPSFADSPTPIFASAAELFWHFEAFVADFRSWSPQRVAHALDWADVLINELRNLTDCDRRLFGEGGVEIYFDLLTHVVQELILFEARREDLTAAEWANLVEVGYRTGALGPGTPRPEVAAEAEQALIDAASAMLEEYYDADGDFIDGNLDTLTIIATGAEVGWTFEVGGNSWDARATLAGALYDGAGS